MKITFLGWMAIFAVIAGVLLILQSRNSALKPAVEGVPGAES